MNRLAAWLALFALPAGAEELSFRSVTNDFALITLSPEQGKVIHGYLADQQASLAFFDRNEKPDRKARWYLFMKFERILFAELSQAQRERINEEAAFRSLQQQHPGEKPAALRTRARKAVRGLEAPWAFARRKG